jgi:beta-glucanase (GH16 family)
VVATVLAVAAVIVVWDASTVPSLTPADHPQLLFSDNFTGTSLDGSRWNPYITSRAVDGRPWNDPSPDRGAGGAPVGCRFDAEYYLPDQVRVSHGLDLVASRRPLSGLCNQTRSTTTYPWVSGAVSTYGHFQFDGGYVVITMRAPVGAGMWPAMWMLPGPGGTHGDDSEIDLQEGGFAPPGPAGGTFAWHLHHDADTWGGVEGAGVDLSAGFHSYALNWVAGQSMTWYFDGRQIARLTNAQASIPDEPMELILDLAVATPAASAWHPPYNASTPSSATMQVSSVQVWTAPPS